jgi:hypothetical protein
MQKQTIANLTILLAACLLYPRCGVTLYVPNTVNSPLLGEKGDHKVNAGLVTQAPHPTFDFQGAYAVSDHVGVMANTSFMSGNDNNEEVPNSHVFLEAAAGFFSPFDIGDAGVLLGRAEIYGGYGFGWSQDFDNGNKFEGQYRRAFVQPAIGFRQKVADFSFSPRMAFIDFYKYEGSPTPTSRPNLAFTTIEPTATVSLGYKRGRFYLQLSQVLVISGKNDYNLVTRFDDGDEYKFNIGGTYSTWRQKDKERPPVSLDKPKQQENGFEKEGKATEAPASINLQSSDFSICIKEGGDPDGDVISLTFNGVYLAKELELARELHCFDVAVAPGQEGVLRIETLSSGIFTPNTLQLLVRQGKQEKRYYIRSEVGEVEEIRFKQE